MASLQILLVVILVCVCVTVSSGQTQAPVPTTTTKPDQAIIWSLWPDNLNSGAKIRAFALMPGYDSMLNATASGVRFHTTGIDFGSVAVDVRQRRMFLSETFHHAIVIGQNVSSNLSISQGLSFKFYHRGHGGNTVVALDYMSHAVYMADAAFKWVLVAPGEPEKIDNDYFAIIVEDDLFQPTGIAVDPHSGTLFISDLGPNPTIQKTDLKGGNRVKLITSGLVYPHALEWDHWDKRLYFIEQTKSTIYWTKSDGSMTTFLRRVERAQLQDMGVFKDALYVIDNDATDGMYTFNKTTGYTLEIKLGISTESLQAVAVFNQEAQPLTTDYCEALKCSHLCISTRNGAECWCSVGYKLAIDRRSCVEDTGEYLKAVVFATEKQICLGQVRMLSDSIKDPVCILYTKDAMPPIPTQSPPPTPPPTAQSRQQTGTSLTPNQTTTTTTTPRPRVTASLTGSIAFLDIDMKNRVIYFLTNESLYKIPIRIDKYNSLREEHLLDLTGIPSGLVYDWIDDNLYWPQTSTGSVFVYSPSSQVLKEIITGEVNPRSMALLPHQRALLWFAGMSGSYVIRKASLNETNPNIMNIVPSPHLKSPVTLVRDKALPRILWAEDSTKTIMAANHDGTNITSVNAVNASTSFLHSYKDFVVWGTSDFRDGNSHFVVYTHGKEFNDGNITDAVITDLRVLDATLQPLGQHACSSVLNSCEQICVSVNSSQAGMLERECQCEVGYTLVNGTKCTSNPVSDNFLLVGDRAIGKIFQIPIDGPTRVEAIMTPNDGMKTGILINRTDMSIIYGVENDNIIRSISLNGNLHYKNLGNIPDPSSYPYRFAYDETTKNLYYTTRGENSFIGVRTPIGVHIKLWSSSSRVPQRLSDLVVHPGKGVMLCSSYGDSSAFIYKVHMDGTHPIPLSPTRLRWPDGLAIDYTSNLLYLADEYYDIIGSFDLDGSNWKQLTFDRNAYILDTAIDDSFVYYTSSNRLAINKISKANGGNGTIVHESAGMGRLEAIAIYRSSSKNIQPISQSCQKNSGLGDCDSICYPTPVNRTCACYQEEFLQIDGKTCSENFVCQTNNLDLNLMLSSSCSRSLNETCKFTCHRGYEYAFSYIKAVTCTRSGWNMDEKRLCREITCPRDVPNGLIDRGCSYQIGTACTFTCSTGYTPALEEAVCLSTGKWDETLCNEITCPSSVPNLTFESSCTYKIKSDCQYKCAQGYDKFATSAKCSADGTWEGPLCKVKTCDRLNHTNFHPGCSFEYNTRCNYECPHGYQSTLNQASCTANGKWSNECEEIMCPQTVPNATFDKCSYRIGITCSFTCADGYEPVGAKSSVVCMSDGQWGASLCKAKITCPKTVADVVFDSSCNFGAGETCNYTCSASGFAHTTVRPTCQMTGKWSGPFCSQVTCPTTVTHLTFDTPCTYKAEAKCTYNCDSGFKNSSVTATCEMTGQWTQPLCAAITCPRYVKSGDIAKNCTYRPGDKCVVMCYKGPAKSSVVTCLPKGEWSKLACSEGPKSSANDQVKPTSSNGTAIGVGVGVTVAVIIIAAVVLFILFRQRQKRLSDEGGNSAARFSGGSNIAIENPGYVEHQSFDQPTYITPDVTPQSRFNGARPKDEHPYATLKMDSQVTSPSEEIPVEVDADDVVLTKDSWLREQAKSNPTAPSKHD